MAYAPDRVLTQWLPPAIRLAEAPLRWSVHSVTLPVHVSDASGNDLPAEIKRPASYALIFGTIYNVRSDPGHAVKPDVEVPPSLVNIYQELHDDLGCKIPNNGYLVKWAKQGVLMLNTVLTVRAHQANSHRGIGWEQFTDAVIRAVNAQDRPIVFLLWGRPAQMKKSMLNNPKHLILEAPHPSPLSAYRGFFGCKHFSQTNAFLEKNGIEPIDWQIEDV